MPEEQQEKRWMPIGTYARRVRQSVPEVLRGAMQEPLILGVDPGDAPAFLRTMEDERPVSGIITLGGVAKRRVVTSLSAEEPLHLKRAGSFKNDHADPPGPSSASVGDPLWQTGGWLPETEEEYRFPAGLNVTQVIVYVYTDEATSIRISSGRDEKELDRTRVLLALCLEFMVDLKKYEMKTKTLSWNTERVFQAASRFSPDAMKAGRPKTGDMGNILEALLKDAHEPRPSDDAVKQNPWKPPTGFSKHSIDDSVQRAIEHYYEASNSWQP